MQVLLSISRAIDWVNKAAGILATLAVFVACAVSAGNAVLRYGFSIGSNAWLEIQWYMFGATVLLGAAYTLAKNEHVRIDLIYGHVSMRTQLWIDIAGLALFLLPACIVIGWVSWPLFAGSYAIGEISSNAGGLIRWPVKLLLPLGFLLLGLQGLSEIVKRAAALRGHPELVARYEKPLQ